jgi:hypothetical protein
MKKASLLKITVEGRTGELNKAIERLARSVVMVGIAAGGKGDRRTDGAPPNHLLGFVHEFGSPSVGIPPRPFLVPGVSKNEPAITSKLKGAMKAALAGNGKEMDVLLEQAGIVAVSGVKHEMSTAAYEPLKPATIKNRNRSRLTKSHREDEVPGSLTIRPLINTGALRDSIDYYVVKR